MVERGTHQEGPPAAEVFVSYASQDRERVVAVVEELAAAGVSLWVDRERIDGASHWAEEIVNAIASAKVVLLMCSDAAMRSWAVKQEIQLAGESQRALLPLMLEPTRFPAQMRFFLAGWQWIDIADRPSSEWLPRVVRALARAGVRSSVAQDVAPEGPAVVEPAHLKWSLEGLRAVARLTDQIWPVPAQTTRPDPPAMRDLGAPQDDAQHGHRLGSRVELVIESEREGHLLLLDEGTSGAVYCLCPSWFAPDTRLPRGRSVLPRPGARYGAFQVTGRPGREHLLAVVTDEPLGFEWTPEDPGVPARRLSPEDVDALLQKLKGLPPGSWTALSTYFDVVP
jgi:hypothetical protein